ncbi:MAG TPA: penicillin-binding protein 1C [Thermoanaerobaculia bacterium]|nr:penicillin-binding protein 1C [Thermoanaerobaculia bacterium]
MRTRRAGLLALAALAAPFLLFFLLDLLFPFPWEALRHPPAVVVLDRSGEPLRFFLPSDQRWRFPVRLSELPPELPRALVASEDRRFYRHSGIDPLAVLRAAWSNVRSGGVVSGASTIPMQIARMADPGPRTLAAKLRESFRALQLERRFTKDELLEVYLNLAPYGGNVEGVGAAAWFYFGKTPDQLSLSEIALLTALPRSPLRYDPTRRPRAAEAARDRVLAQLAARGAFSPREIAEASRQPVPAARQRPPMAAPHFTEQVAALSPGESRLRTTLDRATQRIAEEQVRRRIGELRDQGIGNAAAVVIDNETREVRALVGSAGFLETSFQGQVNGAVARRSPGSTLKPFLYALALDQGRVLPDSYLLDIPTDFSGYVAENYDDRYRGRVTVRDALIQSLNACAVRLLSEVGLADFHHLLKRGGLATLDRPAGQYGLPLVLGAGEVTLLDLTNLYASLAQGGLHRRVRLLAPLAPEDGKDPEPGERLFSPEAARVVAEILTDVRRPDLPGSWDLTRNVPAVAWKTGTSYGHRDAWAVGFSAHTTIGVWVGNFDGRPRQGISGSQHAGPLLFDLFRALDARGVATARPLDWTERAPRLETLEVCALSHELPGPFCPERIEVPYLPGRSRLTACSYHRRVLVDAERGGLLAGDCVSSRPHAFRLLTVYPPELVAWWRGQGSPVEEMPRLSPECHGVLGGEPPRIVSPDPSTPYRLRRDAPTEHQRIPLIAREGAGTARLFWYQDGVLMATTSPGESRFLEPRPGEHRLVVTDDLGRSDGVTYTVE